MVLSAKLIPVLLTVAMVVFPLNATRNIHSQCSQRKSKPQSLIMSSEAGKPPLKARLLPSRRTTLAQVKSTRTTPPQGKAGIVSSDTQAVCSAYAHGYDSAKVDGVCLWTGEHQTPRFLAKDHPDLYPGWVRGDHPANCDKSIKLTAPHNTVTAPVIDGCSFAPEGQMISEADGCKTIWVTEKTFRQLGGVQGEYDVSLTSWQFTDHPN